MKRQSDLKRRPTLFAMIAALATCAHCTPTYASCGLLGEDNEVLASDLDQLHGQLTLLENTILRTNSICQTEQTRAAGAASRAATAESCVALKETAILTGKLRKMSSECEAQLAKLKVEAEAFREHYMEPFQANINDVTKVDQVFVNHFPSFCPSEVNEAKQILAGSQKALERSHRAIAQAAADQRSFSLLEKQTGRQETLSASAFARCASNLEPAAAQAAGTLPGTADSRGSIHRSNTGAPEKSESTITGRIRNASLDSRPGQPSGRIPGIRPPHSGAREIQKGSARNHPPGADSLASFQGILSAPTGGSSPLGTASSGRSLASAGEAIFVLEPSKAGGAYGRLVNLEPTSEDPGGPALQMSAASSDAELVATSPSAEKDLQNPALNSELRLAESEDSLFVRIKKAYLRNTPTDAERISFVSNR